MTATLSPRTSTDALRHRLECAWQRSDLVFSLLEESAWYQRPIALRQPFIFYVGHLPAFGWNQVARGLLGRAGFQPAFDELFARGIDPVGVDSYQPDAKELWPTPREVIGYRDRVRDALRASFDDVASLEGTDVLAEKGRVWNLVIEHELMHHETLLYMLQQLPTQFKHRPAVMPAYLMGEGAKPALIKVPGGEVSYGADFDAVDFGWDNEFPAQQVSVGDFAMDRTPVSNAEFLRFVEDGGYQSVDLWDQEAWAWLRRVGHDHPGFWTRRGDRWSYRTLFDEIPLDLAAGWPAYVSGAEATAYARWKGADLMTEAEFHRAAEGVTWDDPARANIGFSNWAPTPAGHYTNNDSRHGVLDLVGNGWEWTSTPFHGFKGFIPWARTYAGYSADFFDGHHQVILGGSWATDVALSRLSFRNWFQPHYPFVFAKFRTVRRG